MAMRRCPVCKTLSIDRKGVKTCGGTDCLRYWKEMTSFERVKAIRNAEINLIDAIPDSWKPIGEDNVSEEDIPPTSPQTHMPESLAKVYGPSGNEATTEVCKPHGKAMCFICAGILKGD